MASKKENGDEKAQEKQPVATAETIPETPKPVEPPPEPATVVSEATDLLGESSEPRPMSRTEAELFAPNAVLPPDADKVIVTAQTPKDPITQAEQPPANANGQPLPEDLTVPQGEQATVKGWTCPKCADKTYDYRSHLLRHIKRVHADTALEMEKALPAMRTGRVRGVPNKPDFSDIATSVISNQAQTIDYSATAGAMFDMTTGLLTNVFGPEWQPRIIQVQDQTINERDGMVTHIAAYMRSKQMKDIPPGVMLTMVACAYALPRFQAPPTRTKLKMGVLWVRVKVSGLFGMFRKKNKVTIS